MHRLFWICRLSSVLTRRSVLGGVERQQQNAMVGSKRCIDELRDFFLAQDRGKVKWSF
jgi:hypothetical protein